MKEKTCVLTDGLPFLRNYEELKPRLSIRLNNPTHITPDTLSQPFLDFLVTCHIDAPFLAYYLFRIHIMKKSRHPVSGCLHELCVILLSQHLSTAFRA